MYDYLVVGFGLGGLTFTETALEEGKSVFVINHSVTNSSRVAAGMFNPVVLKRFTAVWNAISQIDFIDLFYPKIEDRLQYSFYHKLDVLRKFNSVEEQNNWFVSADKPSLESFLEPQLIIDKVSHIESPYDYGKVKRTGYVDTVVLLDAYIEYLESLSCYSPIKFDYKDIEFHDDYICYNGVKAKHIVFSEGYGMLANPYFGDLPLDGTKGEVCTIKAPNLKLDTVVKAGVFILPIGNYLFKVGATYNWKDKDSIPTKAGKQELIAKLKDIISCDFEVIEHMAEVRPTVRDRRPLVGTHKDHSNIHLLNGLGTRGVMLGPYLSKSLFNKIEYGIPLDIEIDINRFY